jgi:hypothetical protein
MTGDSDGSVERADLLQILRTRRGFLRRTVQGLTDEQARLTPTVSALCLGGLIKHVALTERSWARFAVEGAAGMSNDVEAYANMFVLQDDETLEGVLKVYGDVAAQTDRLVETLDLDHAHALPPAPWFEKGASWTVRQVMVHIVGETAQHAGHADIIRESIDGQKTMG